jgi:hypothetical protein
MYDELIKALRDPAHSLDCEFCDSRYCHPDRKGYGKCIIIKAADAIENMSEAYSKLSRHMDDLAALFPKWVSVLDKLPSVGERVLTTSTDTRGNRFYNVDFIIANGDWFDNGNVTHWMPLPQGPEEGS